MPTYDNPSKLITISLPIVVHKAIQLDAAQKNTSISAYIRSLLCDHLGLENTITKKTRVSHTEIYKHVRSRAGRKKTPNLKF